MSFHSTDAEFVEYFEWLFSKIRKLNLYVDFQEMFGGALYCLDIFSVSFLNQSICYVCNEPCLFACVGENIQFSHHFDRFMIAIQPVVNADIWYVDEFDVNLYLDLAGTNECALPCTTAKWCIKNGADLNIRHWQENETPLMIVIRHKHNQLFRIIMEDSSGINLNLQKYSGKTALTVIAAVYYRDSMGLVCYQINVNHYF